MGHSDEPKMDELKKLLRRLDGLDGSKSLAKKTQETGEDQRGYVGALRGAPAPGDDGIAHVLPLPKAKPSSNSAALVAAAVAALISTVTVYLVMSSQPGPGNQGAGPLPSTERVVPSKLELRQPTGTNGAGQRESNTAAGIVRSAELLMEKGDVAGARALLQQAAEMGSGPAALKLARSYDPTLATAPNFADSQTNPSLAKAWYERALALGTQEAASYISDSSGR